MASKELIDRTTGEVLKTPAKRGKPAINCPEPETGFGALLCHGLDTLEETLDLDITEQWAATLQAAKDKALAADDSGNAVVSICIGPEWVNVHGHGGIGGVQWVISHPSFLVRVRKPKTEWNVSVRYLSVGLWEHGPEYCRMIAHNCVNHLGTPRQEATIKRLDYAFDVQSESFGAEMKRKKILFDIVCPAKAKIRPVMTSGGLQTITLGSIENVQVTVYDKPREIREASGKEWMKDLWRAGGMASGDLDRDVWRVECRFAKKFLRARACPTFDHTRPLLPELISEALYNHRLVRSPGGGDQRMRRWPLHPLWATCARAGASADFPGLGRIFSKQRGEFAEKLIRQAVGTYRAAMVAKEGTDQRNVASEVASFSKRLGEAMEDDVKIDRLVDRYRFLDNGR